MSVQKTWILCVLKDKKANGSIIISNILINYLDKTIV